MPIPPYKNRDLVRFQFGDGVWRYGRVIGVVNPTNTDNPNYKLYVLKPDKRLPGHEWDTIVAPGAMFLKVDPLEEMAYAASKKKR